MTCSLTLHGFDVIGVDSSENHISDGRGCADTAGLEIRFDVSSMLDIPHADEPFDKIVCVELITTC